jgi:hypothetical protein
MATSTLPRISTGPKKVKFFNKVLTKNKTVFAFFHRFTSLHSAYRTAYLRDAYKPDICRSVLVCFMPGKNKKLKTEI